MESSQLPKKLGEHRFIFLGPGASICADEIQKGDEIFLLEFSWATAKENLSHQILATFVRLLYHPSWYEIFSLHPIIVSDQAPMLRVISEAFHSLQKSYISFFHEHRERISNYHPQPDFVLVYSVAEDEALDEICESFRRQGRQVNYTLQPEVYHSPFKAPSGEDALRLLESQSPALVVFRNYFGIRPFNLSDPPLIWILHILGIRSISLQIDSCIDGLSPLWARIFPQSLEIALLHAPESLDITERYAGRSVGAFPQMATRPMSKATVEKMEGVFAATSPRVDLFTGPRKDVFLRFVFLLNSLMKASTPYYFLQMVCLQAYEFSRFIKSPRKQESILRGIGIFSLIYRMIQRFEILEVAEKSLGQQFKLFGKSDWAILFPASYQNEFLSTSQIHKLNQTNILLNGIPNGSFLTQHPTVIKTFFSGCLSLSPTPPDGFPMASLGRFYFKDVNELESRLKQINSIEKVSEEESQLLIETFSADRLVRNLEKTPLARECRGFREIFHLLPEIERTEIIEAAALLITILGSMSDLDDFEENNEEFSERFSLKKFSDFGNFLERPQPIFENFFTKRTCFLRLWKHIQNQS